MTGRAFDSWPDARALPERQPLAAQDASERLSADDLACLHADQLLNAAMLDHQRAAAKVESSRPGVCMNCGSVCLPLAVYCDDDCRSDHEHRVQTQRRQRAGR